MSVRKELHDPFTGRLIGYASGIHVSGVTSESEDAALTILRDQAFAIESGIRGIEDAIQYRAELAHMREQYNELLTSSLRTSQNMSDLMFTAIVKGCITPGGSI